LFKFFLFQQEFRKPVLVTPRADALREEDGSSSPWRALLQVVPWDWDDPAQTLGTPRKYDARHVRLARRLCTQDLRHLVLSQGFQQSLQVDDSLYREALPDINVHVGPSDLATSSYTALLRTDEENAQHTVFFVFPGA
jgi:hypothetical protein